MIGGCRVAAGRALVVIALGIALYGLVAPRFGDPPAAAQEGSVPARPTGLTVTSVSHNFVELSWDAPGDPSITHYELLRRDPAVHALGEFETVDAGTGSNATSYSDDSVAPEQSYIYRVKAVNPHGSSEQSGYARANTSTAPAIGKSQAGNGGGPTLEDLADARTGEGAGSGGVPTTVEADTTAPAIEAVAITSTPGTYAALDAIEVTVTLTEPVLVTGMPEFTIEVGVENREATYRSSSGAELVFVYQVADGDRDTYGLTIRADSLSLAGGTIRDSAGNDALLSHEGLPPNRGHKVDGVKPVLSATDGATANGLTLILTYNEPLDADSLPAGSAFVVSVEGTPRQVTVAEVSDRAVRGNVVRLTLASTLKVGQSLTVTYTPGSTPIRDAAGNPAGALTGRDVRNKTRLGILLITADDLNWDSVGVYGSPVDGATPEIDQLAAEGLLFNRAHVTISVCTPNRSVLLTGRYPHLSGGEGFHKLRRRNVPLLPELLRTDGYVVGVLGKLAHTRPYHSLLWDFEISEELGRGRNPEAYKQYAKSFVEYATDEDSPFFLMANSSDPHRPFYGNDPIGYYFGEFPAMAPSRVFLPEEVVVPGFLPDLPNVRLEIARYHSSVRRLDDTVGRLLDALDEAGVMENTLVIFLSDNGMSMPFSKANVYRDSTRIPWIVRWPGVTQPGSVDSEHFISSIDLLPTILDATGVDVPERVNGTTFLPLLRGESQDNRELVFTQFYETSARLEYPMRSVQNGQFGYIFNAWSNGTKEFRSESQTGLSWKAMEEAGASDADLAARVELFSHRVPQELYDYDNDPHALNNLIDDPDYADELHALRVSLEEWMVQTRDPVRSKFRQHFSSVVITGEAAVPYVEHGTGAVHTYSADDPQGDPTVWSLSGVDAAQLEVSEGGVLSFQSPPDYGSPTDADGDNNYKVTVVASYRGLQGALNVTVTVQVNEPPDISFVETSGVAVGDNELFVDENYSGTLAAFRASDPEQKRGLAYEWSVGGTDGLDFAITGHGVLSFVATPDHERPADFDKDNVYDITVVAVDSDSLRSTVAMAVTVREVNEPPTISGNRVPAVEEEGSLFVGVYTVTDQDDTRIAWLPLDGADKDKFHLNESNGRLEFKTAPDYEDPSHSNVYVVTLSASAGPATATFTVTVTVTNKDEGGTLSLSSPQPQVDADYSATLGDADGVRSTTWTWGRSQNLSGPWAAISAAPAGSTTTSVYTPVADDVGYYLRVTADYTDGHARNKRLFVTAGPVAPPAVTGGGSGGGSGGGPTPSAVEFEWNVTRDIEELASGHNAPTGAWSDGARVWLLQNGSGADDAVYAYDLATGERVTDREFDLDDTNRAPRGVWSDGETAFWVSDSGQDRLFAYDLKTGERDEEREIVLANGNRDARAIWSDGETVWVLNANPSLFVYDITSRELLGEYELADANSGPHGLWSDGVTVWVSDHAAKRLFAYRLPQRGALGAEDKALERIRAEEFSELSGAGNNSPRGIWSDSAVMYVADESDGRVYTYNMPDAIDARLASLALSGVDIGDFDPAVTEYAGVPDDGVTQTTVAAEPVQSGATVTTEPADADEVAEGHQVVLEGVAEVAVTVTSPDGSREQVYRVQLGDAGPSASCLRGAVSVGFNLVVYEGGSIEDLVACAEGRHVTALYSLHEGEYVSYILGAPEFVNRTFSGLFTAGVPALTALTARSEGPPTAAPAAAAPPTGGAVDVEAWPACLRGEIAASFSLVLYAGGTVDDLAACAESLHVTALYAVHEGMWVSYILGAPDFVNRGFSALFPDGLATATPLVVRSEGE